VAGQLPEGAVLETYRATIRPLYAYISRRVGGDVGLAEDLAQETWMRALDAWPRRGLPAEPLAWLLRVARNCLVSHFRRVRIEAVDPSILDLEPSVLSQRDPEHAAIVGWGMAGLRRAHADVLEAFYFDEKSVKEIAAEQSTSERAIEGRLRRARARLRQKLERRSRAVSSLKRISHAGEARTE
jgi:RNA polymerase sigma-70 factor (ECF subfamily)